MMKLQLHALTLALTAPLFFWTIKYEFDHPNGELKIALYFYLIHKFPPQEVVYFPVAF